MCQVHEIYIAYEYTFVLFFFSIVNKMLLILRGFLKTECWNLMLEYQQRDTKLQICALVVELQENRKKVNMSMNPFSFKELYIV